MTVPNIFVPGGIVASAAINENFAALDAQTATLEADLATTTGDGLIGQSNGNTVRQNSPLTIWRRLPSLVGGGVAGTPAQNAARLQTQINTLSAAGGGILQLVEDQIDLDQPLVVPNKVSIIGPGTGRCLLRNTYADTYAAADYRQSPVIQTGNFSTGTVGTGSGATGGIWGDSNSKALNAVASGDMAATLTTAGDASGYAVGDIVIFCSTSYYLDSVPAKLANYMALRRITRISGGLLYVDRPFTEAFTGFAYNLRTGTLLGTPTTVTGTGLPLYVWGDAEIGGFDVDTVWHWKAADAACYDGSFSDIFVQRSRTIAYGNAHQFCTFDNVGGRFMQVFSELAQNSENCVVRNFTAAHDPLAQAAAGVPSFFAFITAAENTLDMTFENGSVNCTGFTGTNPIIRQNNAERLTVRDVNLRCDTAAFAGTVLDIGNLTTTSGRREAKDAQYRVNWSGYNRRYLRIINANTVGNVIDGEYRGTPVFEAFSIDSATGRNRIEPTCFMEQSYGSFINGAANQVVNGCYVGGGMIALTTNTFTTLLTNDVRNISTANTQARRGGTTSLAQPYTVTTSEADALAATIGTATLQKQDAITFSCNVALTGVAGSKTIKFKITDTTTPTTYTILQFVIPAATTGTVTITGTINVTAASAIYAQATCSDGTTVITNTPITTDLSAKAITLSISAIKANAGDGATIPAARIALTNPVQL
jgi:hypothetical protein